ncbi:MAG: AAA family ATPase [Rhodospirillaceae bacterium]|nr:AAA family ATPase [Rhodospirillaceae bacterium]MBT5179553.1 AAA family ATPase [Rhodospirillaceae bacterium]
MKCPNCLAENATDNKFCGQCGTPLPEGCPECGAENPDGNKFCGQCGTPLGIGDVASSAPPAPSPPPSKAGEQGAERRHLTVMFCDLANSTALSEQFDPEDLKDVISEFQKMCAAEIETFGGYIARYMGDGILVYFGYPTATENDPERSVRAGLRIAAGIAALEPRPGLRLHVRVGIATGSVVAGEIIGEGASEEHAVLGVTPNLAARLQSLAPLDGVVISDATHRLSAGFFEFDDLGLHPLKGIAEPQQAWQAIGENFAASRFEAASRRGLTPMVGRGEEIALLQNRWRQSVAGEGQVVILSGEAGVGKSRIVDGFRQDLVGVDHGFIYLACTPFHSNSALYPVIDCLERVLGIEKDDDAGTRAAKLDGFISELELDASALTPYIGPLLFEPIDDRHAAPDENPEERKRRLFEALLTILAVQTGRRPLLMIAEDIHWVDPSTEEFLGALIDRTRDLKLFLLMASRPEYVVPWSGQPHVTTLALNRLGRSDSADLINRVTGGKALPAEVMEQIVLKTDGVPLFVEELTKTVLESGLVVEDGDQYRLDGPLTALAIPESLQDSLMARLDRLSPVKEVAQLASVIGRAFDEELLAAISFQSAAELRASLATLVDAEMIYQRSLPPTARYEFKHAMVQDVAYESLLKSTRQTFHKRVAETLESQFPAKAAAEPEIIGHHFTEAGMAGRAIPCWREAAARALQTWASLEAVNHLIKALDLLGGLDADAEAGADEVQMLIDLVSALRILDRYDEALSYLDRAEAAATAAGQIEQLSLIHYYRGNIYFPLGNIDGCLQEHSQAREFAHQAGSPEKEARALSGLGDAYYLRGQMITANKMFDECVTIIREHDLTVIEPVNLSMRGHTALYMDRIQEGLEDVGAAAERAAMSGNRRAEMVARGSCAGKLQFDNQDYAGAKKSCARALDLARQLGARRFEPINQVLLAKVALIEGNRAEAIRIAEEAVETCRETGFNFAGPMALGALAVVTDDADVRARALLEGMQTLQQDCVSHCYLWFYRDALEVAVMDEDWPAVETYAKAAETYTEVEPLPWMDRLIAAARAAAPGH